MRTNYRQTSQIHLFGIIGGVAAAAKMITEVLHVHHVAANHITKNQHLVHGVVSSYKVIVISFINNIIYNTFIIIIFKLYLSLQTCSYWYSYKGTSEITARASMQLYHCTCR